MQLLQFLSSYVYLLPVLSMWIETSLLTLSISALTFIQILLSNCFWGTFFVPSFGALPNDIAWRWVPFGGISTNIAASLSPFASFGSFGCRIQVKEANYCSWQLSSLSLSLSLRSLSLSLPLSPSLSSLSTLLISPHFSLPLLPPQTRLARRSF